MRDEVLGRGSQRPSELQRGWSAQGDQAQKDSLSQSQQEARKAKDGLGPPGGVPKSVGASSPGPGLRTQSTEVHRKTTHLSLVPRGAQVHMAAPGLSRMGSGGAGEWGFPSSPPPHQVCSVAVGAGQVPGPLVTFRALTVPSAPVAWMEATACGAWGREAGPPPSAWWTSDSHVAFRSLRLAR